MGVVEHERARRETNIGAVERGVRGEELLVRADDDRFARGAGRIRVSLATRVRHGLQTDARRLCEDLAYELGIRAEVDHRLLLLERVRPQVQEADSRLAGAGAHLHHVVTTGATCREGLERLDLRLPKLCVRRLAIERLEKLQEIGRIERPLAASAAVLLEVDHASLRRGSVLLPHYLRY
ncbi:hypothetical protein POL67_52300 [Polyangium sp. rjm3]|uniref:Uncharacterized protein n=1 Tax=Polyangium mundeleinium TaxID=2995306 RepID=A0ABT5F7F2_9BACT|nr:hypothetical protein [Polyangium mundeleinium]MDC0750015.1 hypothetical protein [Polyangium mundeleinium]